MMRVVVAVKTFLLSLMAFPAFAQMSDIQSMHQQTGARVRERLREMFEAAVAANDMPGVTAGLSFEWYFELLWPVFVMSAVGWFVAARVNNWGRNHFAHWYNPQPADRAEKITYLAFRFVMQFLGTVLFVVISFVLIALIEGDKEPDASLQSMIVLYIAMVRISYEVLDVIIAPDTPSHRLVWIDDAAAIRLRRHILRAHLPATLMITACFMMHEVGLDEDVHHFYLLSAYAISGVLWSIAAYMNRHAVAGMITGIGSSQDDANHPRRGMLQVLAKSWHILFITYVVVAVSVSVVRTALALPSAHGLVLSPILIFLGAMGAYGLSLLMIDKTAKRFGAYRQQVLANSDADFEDIADIQLYEKRWQADLVRLAESAVAFLVTIFAFGAVLEVWGVDVSSSESIVVRLADIFIVGFLGYILYQAVKLSLDRRIQEETAGEAEAEPGDEGGAAGSASRLATLLPLFRNFLLITIAAISVMLVLTQMGVDIGPLFAGAGVVGVAVGFGAQTLIRDIFSGAFFLFDDAFRKGEYVEIEGTKGTVEKISLRSFQLRHHLGALHTIPFGEIKQLTNYSRDWAMMKLQLRVTYDTDVEKVRKLIKNLGKELLSHPEVGDKFIQPLKSQGVLAMEDSAMILRVKFMTPPGEQFVVRKLVYAKIRELFAEHDIKFAHREVTVRVAKDGDEDLTEAEKKSIGHMAAAGALRPEEEMEPAGGGAGDDR